MLMSTRPLISDQEADALVGALRRRTLLGASVAAGGILATPLAAFAATAAPEAEITVDQARTAPIPIIIPDFGGGLGQQMARY